MWGCGVVCVPKTNKSSARAKIQNHEWHTKGFLTCSEFRELAFELKLMEGTFISTYESYVRGKELR